MVKGFAWTQVALLLAWGAVAPEARAAAPSCERLVSLALANAKVTSAVTVPPGTFTPLTGLPAWIGGDPSMFKQLPALCRVMAEARPTADSDIKIEVWMPVSGWNGRFLAQDNGGFAGSISYRGLGMAVGRGYAAAGTDTGHSATTVDATWARQHPEKVIDFGYRAVHEMTDTAKAVVKAFYGKGPRRSYFAGCSNGGRQALMEAQRFPADYDGILAGAPANNWTRLLTSALWDAQVTTNDAGSYIPSSKLPAIARSVNDACDGLDAVTDGVVDDPRQCRFDPAAMQCRDGDSSTCLTAPQVTALGKLYAGPGGKDGRRIFPGFLPGAEEGEGGWSTWITGAAPGRALLFAFGNGFFANMVYEKADWNYKTADLDQSLKAAEDKLARTLDATDPNLKPFKDRGGKLILYHGWNDPAISALNTVEYYEGVAREMAPSDVGSFVRLYMAPGVQHCSDGPGPDSFGQVGATGPSDAGHSLQGALEQWVEEGLAPAAIIATASGGKATRPLCPYPQRASYKGVGDTNESANFSCRRP